MRSPGPEEAAVLVDVRRTAGWIAHQALRLDGHRGARRNAWAAMTEQAAVRREREAGGGALPGRLRRGARRGRDPLRAVSVHLRVALPDRPGALAALARALADAGADVESVTVLAREQGRASDDFLLGWPAHRPLELLRGAAAAVPGVQVLGVRGVRSVAHERIDLDLLEAVRQAPERLVETVVDFAPALLRADWAALASLPPAGSPLVRWHTPGTPLPLPALRVPNRAYASAHEGRFLAVLPWRGDVLVVARAAPPPFERFELAHLERLLALVG